jgi:hypothetical protein
MGIRAAQIGWALALVLATGGAAAADPAIGTVRSVEGTATVQRAGVTIAAQVGQPIAQSDVLQTGADGRLAVILKDDTRLSLGPGSEVRVDRFLYEPTQGNLALVVRMARGVVAYVSGKIAKLAPDSVRFETPVAAVGIRGTRFAARVE